MMFNRTRSNPSRHPCVAGLVGTLLISAAIVAAAGHTTAAGQAAAGKPLAAPTGPPATQPVTAADGPPLSFQPTVLDFGTVRPGQHARGSVMIINRGDKPLLIEDSRASCTCTSVSLAN